MKLQIVCSIPIPIVRQTINEKYRMSCLYLKSHKFQRTLMKKNKKDNHQLKCIQTQEVNLSGESCKLSLMFNFVYLVPGLVNFSKSSIFHFLFLTIEFFQDNVT